VKRVIGLRVVPRHIYLRELRRLRIDFSRWVRSMRCRGADPIPDDDAFF